MKKKVVEIRSNSTDGGYTNKTDLIVALPCRCQEPNLLVHFQIKQYSLAFTPVKESFFVVVAGVYHPFTYNGLCSQSLIKKTVTLNDV